MSSVGVFIGIDPGIGGAVVVYVPSEGRHVIDDMPVVEVGDGKKTKTVVSAHALADMLRVYEGRSDVMCAVENVSAMPGQGVVSMFSFGRSFGVILGVLSALRIPHLLVAPQRWKKSMMKDMGKEKDASVVRALQIYPLLSEHLISKRGKKLDGRADALLLSQYAYEISGSSWPT